MIWLLVVVFAVSLPVYFWRTPVSGQAANHTESLAVAAPALNLPESAQKSAPSAVSALTKPASDAVSELTKPASDSVSALTKPASDAVSELTKPALGAVSGQQATSDLSVEGAVPGMGMHLGNARMDACGKSPQSMMVVGSQCDAQPFFERALATSLANYDDCRPPMPGRADFELLVDYAARRVNVSALDPKGSLDASSVRATARCMLNSLPPIPWDQLPHQYDAYRIVLNATFLNRAAR